MYYSEHRDLRVDFSTSHYIANYSIFVRKNSDIHSIDDLKGKEIVVQKGDIMHDYVLENSLTRNIITVENAVDALIMISSGKHDGALISKMQGLYLIKKRHLTNIKPTGKPALSEKYCFAVREGDHLLKSKLDEGLVILKQTGEFHRIHDKWFGVYDSGYSTKQFVKYTIIIFGVLFLITLGFATLSYILKKAINMKKTELESEFDNKLKIETEKKIIERKLFQKEQVLASMLSNTPAHIYLYDNDYRFVYASRAGMNMLGITENPAGKKISDLNIDLNVINDFEKKLMHVFKNGKYIVDEIEQQTIDGLKIFEYSLSPILNDSGEIEQVLSTVIDITDRKTAENALRASESKYRELFERSIDAIFLYDANGRIIGANKKAQRITNKSSDELYQLKMEQIFVLDESNMIFNNITDNCILETSLLCNNIFAVYFELNLSVIDHEKKLYQAIARDITERKQHDEEVSKLISVIENSWDFIGIADLRGNVLYINRAGRIFVGLDEKEDVTKYTIADFAPVEERYNLENIILAGVYQEGLWKGNVKLRNVKTGKNTDVFNTVFKVNYPGTGMPMCIATQMQDITEQIKNESEKALLLEQLFQSQKMEAIGVLAGGMAHDFNNLLAVIMGNANLALEDMKKSDTGYYELSEILTASEKAKDLTMKILTFARKEKVEVKTCDINKIVEQVIGMLKRSITKKIVIETQIDKTLPPVNIDANQIHQAIIHICTNACDSMSDGGILTLKTFKGTNNNTFGDSETAIPMDNYCIVSVKDTGSGIPKSIVKKVFDPFFTTKPIGKGTGLGLSITHSLVKNHGGHISIESEEGKGTTVLIYLPLANDNLSISEVKEAEHPAGGNEKILLIDDEDSVLRITEKMLTKAGYDVISASSGIQGIDIFNLNKDDFDLVIIDLIMPEMDGHETYEKIREIKPGIKVVFLSGFSIDGKHHKLIDNITCAFIQKPFGYTKLLSKIRAILDTKENAT